MSASKERPKVGQNFFLPSVTTEKESLCVMKRLIATSVSSILYYRGVFPPECYGTQMHNNMKLHILRSDSAVREAQDTMSLLKGAFQALERKYLKHLVIAFLDDPDKTEDFVEAYIIRIGYGRGETSFECSKDRRGNSTVNLGNVTSNQNNGVDVSEQTEALINKLKTYAKSIDAHEKQCYMVVKLFYNDDAPPNYTPDGFHQSDTDEFNFGGDFIRNNCGDVKTRHHKLNLKVVVEKANFEPTKQSKQTKRTKSRL
ncbi:HORMA domain-containing protein 1 [Halotydeus destructor]|nr:HORMA domain-containing protein 1 [Halotydeus destructor]